MNKSLATRLRAVAGREAKHWPTREALLGLIQEAADALEAKPSGAVPLPVYPYAQVGCGWTPQEERAILAYGDAREAAARTHPGEVTVTTNDKGQCVAVTRTDEDHRILSVIWKAPPAAVSQVGEPVATLPDGFHLVAVNDGFDTLMGALERAHRKGYMPEVVVEDYEGFDYRDVPTHAAPVADDVARDAGRYQWLAKNGRSNDKNPGSAVVGTPLKAKFAFHYWCSPEELGALIDAAMATDAKASNEPKNKQPKSFNVPFDKTLNDLGFDMNDFLVDNGAKFDGRVFNHMKGFLRECIMKWLAANAEAVAVRYDYDGDGYMMIDNGSGSGWREKHPEGEFMYVLPTGE